MKPISLHTPENMGLAAIQGIENVEGLGRKLLTGIPKLDNNCSMFTPGKVIAYQAVTSHGKSTVMLYAAQAMAKQCKEDEIVLFVTFEDSLELFVQKILAGYTGISLKTMHNGELTEHAMMQLKVAATKVQASKLWVLGHSEDAGNWERMSMTSIFQAMDWLKENNIKVVAVYIDYLQRINMTDLDHRYFHGATALFTETVNRIKQLAIKARPLVFYATQVDRDILKTRDNKMPYLGDGKYTGNIEETADAVISAYIPWKYPDLHGNMVISPTDTQLGGVIVTPDLYLMEVQKSKLDETPTLIPLSANWKLSQFSEWVHPKAV